MLKQLIAVLPCRRQSRPENERQQIVLPDGTSITLTDAGVRVGEDVIPYEEILWLRDFYREDKVILKYYHM